MIERCCCCVGGWSGPGAPRPPKKTGKNKSTSCGEGGGGLRAGISSARWGSFVVGAFKLAVR